MENLINRSGEERTIERISHNKIRVMGNSYYIRKSSEYNQLTMFDFEGGPCLNVGGKIKFEKLDWQILEIKEEETQYPNFASVQLIVSPIY
jgi:hypothetical protein